MLFYPPLRQPPETLPLKPVNKYTIELSLIERRDKKRSGISAFVTGKFSITVIVFILTRMFFHKAFYLLFFHYQNMHLNQTHPHFDFPYFKMGHFFKAAR